MRSYIVLLCTLVCFTIGLNADYAKADEDILQRLIASVVDRFSDWITRDELEEIDATVMRGDENSTDIQCFPYAAFRLEKWPSAHTTILFGQPLLIRDETLGNFCEETLVTISNNNTGSIVHEVKGKVGEFISLPKDLEPGVVYTYSFVTTDGTQTAGQSFTVMSRKETERITQKMEETAKQFSGTDPLLIQALYLQQLSENTEGVDLYADSLRLLMKYWQSPVDPVPTLFSYLIDKAWDHEPSL